MIAYEYLWLLFLFHDILYAMFGVWDEESDNFSKFICLDAIAIQLYACTDTHSQTKQRQTSNILVCRIQSLCNIVSLEFYKLYVDRNHPAPTPTMENVIE